MSVCRYYRRTRRTHSDTLIKMSLFPYKKRVAIIVSSVGFHWEELAAAYKVLVESNVEVKFFTPSGNAVAADPHSLIPRKYLSYLGMGSPLEIAPTSEFGKNLWHNLKLARPIVEMNSDDFSGLYLPGGHGCLFDVNTNPVLHNRILAFYQSKKPLAGVCHATSTFAYVQNQGVFIVEGKYLTGFPDLIDNLLIKFNAIDPKFLPIPFSNDGKIIASNAKNPISQRLMACLNPSFTVVDPPFITGVGPKASALVAQELITYL